MLAALNSRQWQVKQIFNAVQHMCQHQKSSLITCAFWVECSPAVCNVMLRPAASCRGASVFSVLASTTSCRCTMQLQHHM